MPFFSAHSIIKSIALIRPGRSTGQPWLGEGLSRAFALVVTIAFTSVRQTQGCIHIRMKGFQTGIRLWVGLYSHRLPSILRILSMLAQIQEDCWLYHKNQMFCGLFKPTMRLYPHLRSHPAITFFSAVVVVQ